MQQGFAAFPPAERWEDWVEARPALQPGGDDVLQLRSGLRTRGVRRPGDAEVKKFEGNPYHPGSRGRNCAKGPATLNQIHDPERILYPMRRVGRARRREVGARELGRGIG